MEFSQIGFYEKYKTEVIFTIIVVLILAWYYYFYYSQNKTLSSVFAKKEPIVEQTVTVPAPAEEFKDDIGQQADFSEDTLKGLLH